MDAFIKSKLEQMSLGELIEVITEADKSVGMLVRADKLIAYYRALKGQGATTEEETARHEAAREKGGLHRIGTHRRRQRTHPSSPPSRRAIRCIPISAS
jgi:hypothetical protein